MSTIEINAGTIHYEEFGPKDGRPVVFVHGYMMGGQLWRQVSARLASQGLRCIVPTWPLGAHPEPLRPGADRSIRGVANIVADTLAALDLDDVVLVGNDTGGVVTQLVAVHHPERIGALVLTSCDAFEHFPPPILKPLIAAAKSKAERAKAGGKDVQTAVPEAAASKEARAAKTTVAAKADLAEKAGKNLTRASLSPPAAGTSKAPASPVAEPAKEAAPAKPTKEALFLRAIHSGACGPFGTVLGPEANDPHRNHFHLDLIPRRNRGYCE